MVINGGDGTVQRALTELLEARPFERVPPLAILPRGMANMTAGDVGLRGSPRRALARLIERARRSDLERSLVRRRILRIENIAGASVQRCMFFGAAAIYDAIELCCKEVYARGLKGNLGMSLTLAGLLLGNLLGRSGRVLRGHEIGVAIDDQPPILTRRLLVLATTLDRLILGSRPFWNQGAGSIRFTSIAHPPPQLLRSAAKVLYGWRRTTLSGGELRQPGRGADRARSGWRFHPGRRAVLAGAGSAAPAERAGERRLRQALSRWTACSRLIAEESAGPRPPAIAAVAEAARQRHGDAIVAVLLYGSCLRERTGRGQDRRSLSARRPLRSAASEPRSRGP